MKSDQRCFGALLSKRFKLKDLFRISLSQDLTTRITLTDSYMAIWPSTLALPTPHSSPGAGWRCDMCAREVRGALLRCVSKGYFGALSTPEKSAGRSEAT